MEQVASKFYAPEELEFVLGMPGEDALVQLGFSDPEQSRQLLREWDKSEAESAHPDHIYPDIEEVLRALQKKGIVLGVVTSRTNEQLKRIDFIGLSTYFTCIVSADDTERHKPNPDPLNKFFEISGRLKDGAIYIGDSRYDSLCAKSAGVRFALGLWGAKSAATIEADMKLDRPVDILGILHRGTPHRIVTQRVLPPQGQGSPTR